MAIDNNRKNQWRRSKGRAYLDERNDVVKAYQNTFLGWLSLTAGRVNNGARARGMRSRIGSADLMEVWIAQNKINLRQSVCAICGCLTTDWNFDHITPLFKGGLHERSNIQILCVDCHRRKTSEEMKSAYIFRDSENSLSQAELKMEVA